MTMFSTSANDIAPPIEKVMYDHDFVDHCAPMCTTSIQADTIMTSQTGEALPSTVGGLAVTTQHYPPSYVPTT